MTEREDSRTAARPGSPGHVSTTGGGGAEQEIRRSDDRDRSERGMLFRELVEEAFQVGYLDGELGCETRHRVGLRCLLRSGDRCPPGSGDGQAADSQQHAAEPDPARGATVVRQLAERSAGRGEHDPVARNHSARQRSEGAPGLWRGACTWPRGVSDTWGGDGDLTIAHIRTVLPSTARCDQRISSFAPFRPLAGAPDRSPSLRRNPLTSAQRRLSYARRRPG